MYDIAVHDPSGQASVVLYGMMQLSVQNRFRFGGSVFCFVKTDAQAIIGCSKRWRDAYI